jgi:anaerobic dimethyl sulfoxide reductase subunit B (iron-sulfur subunit)
MAKQFAFHFDSSACNGCKACAIACKSKNDLPVGINFRQVVEYGGGSWVPDPRDNQFLIPNNVFVYSLSISCNHCQDPTCVNVCPTTAMTKRSDGIVVIDASKCIGCRYCEWACPYGAPQFDQSAGVMRKCDFCVDEIEQGGQPYCVSTCVMRALDFGELADLQAKYGSEASIEPLPTAEITQPSLVITPHRNAQKSGQGTGRILDLQEA